MLESIPNQKHVKIVHIIAIWEETLAEIKENNEVGVYLYLEGRPSMPIKTQRNYHLLLPGKMVETIEKRIVSGALNTTFVVLLYEGLDLLKRRLTKEGIDLIVDAEREVGEEGYVLNQSLKDNLAPILATPPKRISHPVLRIKRRMASLDRREFTLILPEAFSKEIDASITGPRNSAFLVLLSVGLEDFRVKSEDGMNPLTLQVPDFFKTHWYS